MRGSLTLDQALEKARRFRREQGWSQIGCSSSSEEPEGFVFVFGRPRKPQQAIGVSHDGARVELLWQKSR